MSNNKAIGAHALGGEAGTIGVASPLLGHDPSTTIPQGAVPPAATAMMTTTSSSASVPNPKISSTTASQAATSTTGLHSPPDSNNATKLDGSSDSELSDLDDDALAESFHTMQPGNTEDTGASAMTPSTTAADTVQPPEQSAGLFADPDAPASTSDSPAEADDIGDVEPDHYSGTVPVFRPTMHQFQDFKKFVRFILPSCFLPLAIPYLPLSLPIPLMFDIP